MRICIAQRITMAHPIKGGMERHLHMLARGLAARAHDVHVITTAHPQGLAEDVQDGVHYHYLSPYSYRRYDPAWWAASYRRFTALHEQQPFSIFCSQSAGALGYLSRLKPEHGLAVVVILHGTLWSALLTQVRGARSARGLYRLARLAWVLPGHYRLWRKSAPVVDRYIAVSHEVAEGWRREFNLPAEQVSVVLNGVDIDLFRPSAEMRAATRQRLGLAPDQPVLVTTSRLEYEKGVQLAIRALRELPDNAALLIAGAGAYRQALERLTAQLGLADRVRFLGFVPHQDLPAVLNAADVFLAPTLCQEGLMLTAIEAQACGLPVVATAASGVLTAVQDGVGGHLFPMGDSDALVSRVRHLIEDPALRAQMGAKARANVEAHFSQSLMVTETEAIFLSIVAAAQTASSVSRSDPAA